MNTTNKALSDQLHAVFLKVLTIRGKGGASDSRALEELAGEISDIRKKLATAKIITVTSEKLSAAKKTLASIGSTIAAKESAMAELDAKAPNLSERFVERGDLLAEIALGNAKESDLTAFDKKLESESKAVSKEWEGIDENLDEMGQMVNGLARKADTVRAEIAQLTEELSELSLQAVLAVALDKAEQYTKSAMETIALYREVTTLSTLVQTDGWGKQFNAFLGRPFDERVLIPALNAPPFSGEYREFAWRLFDLDGDLRNFRRIAKHVPEVEALRKSGAIIPDAS
ncbi:hypothetical protein EGT07_08010 [Herbaspirillum sp. HC18]|nr:hypothetical protein EGT07_08010 [Herbaspirillum sp. HC18]